jgi:excisionase family DNA binding protein
MNVHEVAAMLGISVSTVYRLDQSGEMPRRRRLGGLVRWARHEIEEWIKTGSVPKSPAS